jgi:hypothetical protein
MPPRYFSMEGPAMQFYSFLAPAIRITVMSGALLAAVTAHAADISVVPPTPTTSDQVQIVVSGTLYDWEPLYCSGRGIEGVTCSPIGTHTFGVEAHDNQCYGACDADCGLAGVFYGEWGRCALGTLAAGHYVLQVNENYGAEFYTTSFNVTGQTPTQRMTWGWVKSFYR